MIKERKTSYTAEASTIYRASESLKKENERVCHDPIAREFVNVWVRSIYKNRLLTNTVLSLFVERRFPGSIGFIVCRTRYIDDYLKDNLTRGINQLVILGAGYDTRAYRFDELKGKINVFEVDHPATQTRKIQKVEKLFGTRPEHVVYVPIDFEGDKLDKKLFDSGYREYLKTLFIWEGTTYYLTPSAVVETLAFVANNSGEGSSIIFDYLFKSVVDGTSEYEVARKTRKMGERLGEPFRFGLEFGEVVEFLSKRGFHQIENVRAEDLKIAYFIGRNSKRQIYPFFGFVHATGKPRTK